MKKTYYRWTVPLTGAVLISTAVSAEQNKSTYLNSTNRLTLSLRFGLNIDSKFKGTGGSFGLGNLAGNNGRLTPNGGTYNYDDGYVLTDSTGNFLGLTTYWGYDNTATQYNPAAGTIDFHNSSATGVSSRNSGDDQAYPGLELTYDRELLRKENWHDLRFGIEGAVNYLKIHFTDHNTSSSILRVTSTYQLPGTPPVAPPVAAPGTPFQGTYDGSPGGYALLGATPISISTAPVPGASFLEQDKFDGDLLGFRLGPYVELPVGEKFSLHLSGGAALGLLYDQVSWKATFTDPSPGGLNSTATGGGHDYKVLWGFYVGLDAAYQFNEDWAIEGGVQFQDIGKYSHNFGGRTAELNLSRSLFVQLGISYSF